jgi:diketogulonate reductase-like aldo/keto reductase
MRRFTPIGGQDLNKPIPYDPKATIRDQIRASLTVSLRNLRVSYIDSYLLHSPLRTIQATLEAWRALIVAQDAGTIRKIGVSNVYDVPTLAALGKLRKVQVVQNRWCQENMWDLDVWRYCKDNGIEYQFVKFSPSWCLLLDTRCDRSFWTLSGSPRLLAHAAVVALASKLDVTPAQVVFKLAQLHDVVPLTGTTNELHMQQDLAAERIAFSGEVETLRRNVIEFVWGK